MTDNSIDAPFRDLAPWENRHPFVKILMLLLMALLYTFLFAFIGFICIILINDVNIFTNPNIIQNYNDPNVIKGLKLLQLFNQIGMFLLPPIFLALMVSRKRLNYLSLDKTSGSLSFILIFLMALLALPIVNLVGMLNQQMHLPDFLQGVEDWMRNSEDNATRLIEKFMEMKNIGDLLINIFIIAIMAAVSEELFFRGVLQRLFKEWIGNIHISILITAILFSAWHMQFFGFFPRMLLGVFFGYLLHWSGSLYLPILAHFTNNATAVLIRYLIQKNVIPESAETVGATSGEMIYAGACALILAAMAYVLRNMLIKQQVPVNG